jgi:hypothetical protein
MSKELECQGFGELISGRPQDSKRLTKTIEGIIWTIEIQVDTAEVVQRMSLSVRGVNADVDVACLLEAVHSLVEVPKLSVDVAEVVQGGCVEGGVAYLTLHFQ